MPAIKIFAENISKAIDQSPQIREEILRDAADELLNAVRENIGSRLNDSQGHVRAWQRVRIGSKRGYAVIEPVNEPKGRNGPGAVTGYLERGHGIRRPKGGRNYRPRIRVTHVPGRGFYRAAEGKVYTALQNAGNRIMERIGSVIEGE